MYNIKLLNKISYTGLDNFDKKVYSYGEEIDNPDAILVRSASMHDMEFGDNLLCIGRAGAGVNNIPISRCSEEGIVVFNTPGANANAVKELVLASLILSSRRIIPAIEWEKGLKGNGDEIPKLVEKGKSQFQGPEIAGKKLGVVGLGAIGVLVANAAKSLGMTVYGYDPYLSVDAAWSISRSIIHANSLKEIFTECDYISLHVPATPDTKNMINSQSIALMKKGVRIVNCARGELVNTQDMIAALGTGEVATYVTDFANDDLIGVDGVVAIPHLGASTPESEDNCADMVSREVIDFIENGNIRNSVNLPTVDLGKPNFTRITCIHKNVPNMLSQVNSIIGDEGLNIETMVSRSKKDFAYSVIEVNGEVTSSLSAKISAIDGMIKVRIIKK